MDKNNHEKATLAGGCFWGIEYVFQQLKGIKTTQVGYTGGQLTNPTYEDVCTGKTGHLEAVEIIFFPDIISYKSLLEIFFNNHDPTQEDGQGLDIGSQYHSAIFYHSNEQRIVAVDMIYQLEQKIGKKIVTLIKPAMHFYQAESYHQSYYKKNGIRCCKI